MLINWHIGIIVEGELHFDNPGVVGELFADARACSTNAAWNDFPTYNHGQFDVPDESSETVEKLLVKASQQAGVVNRLDDYIAHAFPVIQENGWLFKIENTALSIATLSERLGITRKLNLLIVFNGNAGEVFHGDDGEYRYYFHSREGKRHSKPHVHVDYRHEMRAPFSLLDGKQISGRPFPQKVAKHIKSKIISNQEYLIDAWNQSTDGIIVSIDYMLKHGCRGKSEQADDSDAENKAV